MGLTVGCWCQIFIAWVSVSNDLDIGLFVSFSWLALAWPNQVTKKYQACQSCQEHLHANCELEPDGYKCDPIHRHSKKGGGIAVISLMLKFLMLNENKQKNTYKSKEAPLREGPNVINVPILSRRGIHYGKRTFWQKDWGLGARKVVNAGAFSVQGSNLQKRISSQKKLPFPQHLTFLTKKSYEFNLLGCIAFQHITIYCRLKIYAIKMWLLAFCR